MTDDEWQVGSIARVKRPSHQKAFGKAMIAMMMDGNTVSILWEPISPQPLLNCFLVAPRISESNAASDDSNDDETETTVPVNELLPLMDFETRPPETIIITSNDIGVLKEHGDALLRVGDASAAVAYYEAALFLSCQNGMRSPSIGSSIILKTKGGYLKVAEIDCVEEGETKGSFSLDVTFVESGEEMEVSNSAVVLGILIKDGGDRLQERILLNLSRCLHQLADIDAPKHRPAYLKGAILACSLAMVLAEFHAAVAAEDDNNNAQTTKSKGTLQSALQLRAKAFILLSKWPHAKQDAKRLIKEGKEQQGKSLLDNIEKRKQMQVKKDKKLAKAVAKLVQNVTSDGESRSSGSSSRF
mmetsp:Transcript_26216/g.63890  ORF Transcript_26216/g.63890 Transcript_26216/m.63890 type:complete len:357 (+) Transcript_26216:96-1166(+)